MSMTVRKGMETIDYAKTFGFWTVVENQKKAGRKYCSICGNFENPVEICNFGVFCQNPECRAKRCHIPGHGVCIACGHMPCRYNKKCKFVSNPETKDEHLKNYCHHELEDRIRWCKLWILSVINNPETAFKIKNMTSEEVKDIKEFEAQEKKKKIKDQRAKEYKIKKQIKKDKKQLIPIRDEEGNINFITVEQQKILKREEYEREQEEIKRQEEKEQKEKDKLKYIEEFPSL